MAYKRGISAPHRHLAAEARELLGEAERTDERVTVAGRIMAKRLGGGVTFMDLVDRSGRIQLLARLDELGAESHEAFNDLHVGDIISATGPVMRTRRGEVSIEVAAFELLSRSLRQLPEKWHGLQDVEQRYRQRYLDLIANPLVREVFEARSKVVRALRSTLDAKDFLEVETPVLQAIPGGGFARPFATHHNALHRDLFLRIALELPLKRLVVGGLERVYELGRVFRNEGISPKYNPEFTMLEVYQAYTDLEGMMGLTEELIAAAAAAAGRELELTYLDEPLDFNPPYRRARMVDLVREKTGIDVMALDQPALLDAVREAGVEPPPEPVWGALLNELYEKRVEGDLRQPTFVTDYPIEVSPLARRREDDERFVERFELVVAGRELANAFTELTDPVDQRARFEDQRRRRQAGDEEAHPFDEDYLVALEHGLPPTGGMGMGVDRLVMILTDQPSIRDVILFPAMRD